MNTSLLHTQLFLIHTQTQPSHRGRYYLILRLSLSSLSVSLIKLLSFSSENQIVSARFIQIFKTIDV